MHVHAGEKGRGREREMFLNVFLFVRESERERARIPSRFLHAVKTEPETGLKLTNRKIMT